MKLSKNFTLDEIFNGYRNSKSQAVTCEKLALSVLQPIRDYTGKPVRISSGYRTPKYNKRIGGSPTSDHTFLGTSGAVDISIPNHKERYDVYKFLFENCKYSVGQVIYYLGTTHLHISIVDQKNRGEFFVHNPDLRHKYEAIKNPAELLKLDNRLEGVTNV